MKQKGVVQRSHIDDIVEGIVRLIDNIPSTNPNCDNEPHNACSSSAPYKLYNIGNNNPVELMVLIKILESYLGKKAKKNLVSMQAGDVPATYADIDDLIKDTGFKPVTPLEDGIKRFVEWYRSYFRI